MECELKAYNINIFIDAGYFSRGENTNYGIKLYFVVWLMLMLDK